MVCCYVFAERRREPRDVGQGSKNLLSKTRQGGSERKVLVAKVAVKKKLQSPN